MSEETIVGEEMESEAAVPSIPEPAVEPKGNSIPEEELLRQFLAVVEDAQKRFGFYLVPRLDSTDEQIRPVIRVLRSQANDGPQNAASSGGT